MLSDINIFIVIEVLYSILLLGDNEKKECGWVDSSLTIKIRD